MKIFVKHRSRDRLGRGFSIAEIVDAKLSWQECARLKLHVDPKRRTVYKENVKTLLELEKHVPGKKNPKKTKAQRTASKSQSKPEKKNE